MPVREHNKELPSERQATERTTFCDPLWLLTAPTMKNGGLLRKRAEKFAGENSRCYLPVLRNWV